MYTMSKRKEQWLRWVMPVVALALGSTGAGMAGPVRSVFNPNEHNVTVSGSDYLGDLTVASSGMVTITTGTAGLGNDTGVNLVCDPDGGGPTAATTYHGQVAVNASNTVELAVFAFQNITIPSGVTINLTGGNKGNRGLVLASRGNLYFHGTINANGGDGQNDRTDLPGGPGGAGAEAGPRGGATDSAPPDSNRGNGGQSGFYEDDPAHDGYGKGAGQGVLLTLGNDNRNTASGGGGYGGAGGNGEAEHAESSGGASYGDNALRDLYGGSGGGGNSSTRGCSGGGAGGAVELVARGKLIIYGTATISANGGAGGHNWFRDTDCGTGGGGSGGGILLAGRTVECQVGCQITANGGSGGDAGTVWSHGGRGGGGRIAFYVGGLFTSDESEWDDDLTNCDANGNDGILDAVVDGLTVDGTVKAIKGATGNGGAHGKIYAVKTPLPPAGMVFIVR